MNLKSTIAAVFAKLQDANLSNYPQTAEKERALMVTWLESFERNNVKPSEAKSALESWIDGDRKGFMPAPGAFLDIIRDNREERSAVIEDPVMTWEDGCWRIASKASCIERGAEFMESEFNPVLEDLKRLPVLDNPPLADHGIVRRDA